MARAIMIQGTMSNVGKSLIAAGLCRIFKQDGYRVAPFKSQNMALNAYITKDNLEMGRAQAVQAEACGIEPDVCMNPILLKPTTDMGSQVILNGRAVGNMQAVKYFKKKKEYIPVIQEAYDKLAAQYDIIVIEGAGSPAEINLKQDDIVNMGMAEMADAPVLLVGDIDRGGVFAQLIGTVMLLEKEEKERVKGIIVNKFRGDKKILEPGLVMLEERCGREVLGVVPICFAALYKRQNKPRGGVSILPAVFAHAFRIIGNISYIFCFFKRRIEQLYYPEFFIRKLAESRFQRNVQAVFVRRVRQRRPALNEKIYLALVAVGTPQNRAVIGISANEPVAVPSAGNRLFDLNAFVYESASIFRDRKSVV